MLLDQDANPVRILVMIDTLAFGGAERCAVDLACGIDRRVFAPHVLVTRSGGPLELVLQRHEVPYTVLGRRQRFDFRAFRAIRAAVHAADVIHAHKFGSGVWASLLSGRTPLLVHEHNWTDKFGLLDRLVYKHLVARRASAVLCVSDSVSRGVRMTGVPSRRVKPLPNAVVHKSTLGRDEARRLLGLDTNAPLIGMIAGFRPEKAHEVAIDALADPRLASSDARLVLIGSGPSERFLRERARERNVADRIDWLGAIPDLQEHGRTLSAGAAYAAAFDVALVCSDWEGLPLFALEAMSAGAPLVSTGVGELPSLCAEGRGWLVPPRKTAELAQAIDEVLSDPVAARARADRAQSYVVAHHSFAALTAQLEREYRSLHSDSRRHDRENAVIEGAA